MSAVCRFAPSTTGPAHLGTLAAALLCWLDARSSNARLVLRLEDLDPERCKPSFARSIVGDFAWFGLDWDVVVEQHELRGQHEDAMDRLERSGRLYPCSTSREELRALGKRTPDDGYAYDNRARGRSLPPGGWRACREAVRAQLPEGPFIPIDLGGVDLSGAPAQSYGDPIVRRRDGAIAYHLASVVDDAAAAVTRVVRGRDIAPHTATQAALMALLGLRPPVYRHHVLLLDALGKKLAKSRSARKASTMTSDPRRLCGALAAGLGIIDRPDPVTPAELLSSFTWSRVSNRDLVVRVLEDRIFFDGESANP